MPVTHVDTPSGPAGLHVDGPEGAPGRVVLGHGSGGGVEALDLRAARDAAVGLGLQAVRVEQPWRVRGRRIAEPAARLDAAWLAALAHLPPLPCVVGGRSTGARVACRTAGAVPGVRGVLCLAFPLVPPRGGASRVGELALPDVPRLVVQGERDAFGVPEPGPGVRVHVVSGADHAFAVPGRRGLPAGPQVREVVAAWLAELLSVPATRQALT